MTRTSNKVSRKSSTRKKGTGGSIIQQVVVNSYIIISVTCDL